MVNSPASRIKISRTECLFIGASYSEVGDYTSGACALLAHIEKQDGKKIVLLAKTPGLGNNPTMEIHEWNKRYRLREHAASDLESPPTPLLVETAKNLAPGRALDLACGAGRNAIWLAEQGWEVTAVDGAVEAIDILRGRAAERGLKIETVVADLERGEFDIGSSRWDLVAICYYLQQNLYEPAKRGVKPGGTLISIVHIAELGQPQTRHSLRPGELEGYFSGWEILHLHEGLASDAPHRRPVAEIVARRPRNS